MSGDPPSITGILDFEFSGFFPASEEFIQDHIRSFREWPIETYKAYLERLEELGVETPAKSIDKHVWHQLISIFEMIENVSPWWLPKYDMGDLKWSLKEAETVVLDRIGVLEEYAHKARPS